MSRNNKNAREHQQAREWGALRKRGEKGPTRTTTKHGKVNVKWKSKEVMAARNAILSRGKVEGTVLEKLKGDKNVD